MIRSFTLLLLAAAAATAQVQLLVVDAPGSEKPVSNLYQVGSAAVGDRHGYDLPSPQHIAIGIGHSHTYAGGNGIFHVRTTLIAPHACARPEHGFYGPLLTSRLRFL